MCKARGQRADDGGIVLGPDGLPVPGASVHPDQSSIIEFTQRGGVINVVVTGINVGAQPYWNAEATMLMHTRGILVMTPESSMVLTGKQALDYSGSVSAEDNSGIGGYDRIMGPNGQAQYAARDLADACHILLRHYDHTYVMPGERFPRRAATTDLIERDVCDSPHGHVGASTALYVSFALMATRISNPVVRRGSPASVASSVTPRATICRATICSRSSGDSAQSMIVYLLRNESGTDSPENAD